VGEQLPISRVLEISARPVRGEWHIGPTIGGIGVTIHIVSRTTNAVLQSEADTEVMAVHLFGRAYESGVVITRRWVNSELDRLKSHGPTCRCNEPCQISHQVPPARVDWIAANWQRQYRKSRVLARR
jgi:hypothetical protein